MGTSDVIVSNTNNPEEEEQATTTEGAAEDTTEHTANRWSDPPSQQNRNDSDTVMLSTQETEQDVPMEDVHDETAAGNSNSTGLQQPAVVERERTSGTIQLRTHSLTTGDRSNSGSGDDEGNDRGRFVATNTTPRSSTAASATTTTSTHHQDSTSRGRAPVRDIVDPPMPVRCINPASDINGRLDTQVEVRVYPCNNSQVGKKKFTSFTIKPEGVIIQGSNRNNRAGAHADLGVEYSQHVGRKLQRFELSDNRACQLLVTTHAKSFWVVPAPEAFSRHSGTCRLLGDRKHQPCQHTLQVGDFLRVGSVGVVVIETHNGFENKILSEEKIQKIMKDTTNSNGGFLDLAETDGGECCCCCSA